MTHAPNATVSLPKPADDSEPPNSLSEMMAKQRIAGPQDLDSLAAPDLWESDEEFEAFLAWLRKSRQEGN